MNFLLEQFHKTPFKTSQAWRH